MLVYDTMYRACGNPVHFSFIMIHPENQSCLSPEREKPCIVLVDGTYHLFRAYHALPPLHNQAGEPTGALHGAIKIITKLRWYKPEKLVVVFDAGGKNFRHDLLTVYKQNRPPAPDELLAQIEPLKQLLRALGLPVLCLKNIEADDVIATLARQAQRRDWRVIIATGDKDLAQLVNHDIVLSDRHGQILDSAAVEKKYGVVPDKIVDLLCLTGDKVDNIAGVEKVGPVTAAKWIHRFGDLDHILDQAGSISGKVGENLRARIDQVRQNRELVTLRDNVDTVPDWTDLAMQAVDRQTLQALCEKWQLRQLLQTELSSPPELPDTAAPEQPEKKDKFQLILKEADIGQWLHHLQQEKCFALAMKTDNADPLRATLVGLAFATESGRSAYVPLASDGEPKEAGVTFDQLKSVFSYSAEKLFHNLKHHAQVLENHDTPITGAVTDTMLEAYVLDSGRDHDDLNALAGYIIPDAGNEAAGTSPGEGPVGDACACMHLHLTLEKRLADQPSLRKMLRSVEMPVVPILARMERDGVQINQESLREQSQDLEQEIKDIEARVNEEVGEPPVNLNSSKQVQELLFDRLKLPAVHKTPSGAFSSSERALQELAAQHPLPDLILRHRRLSKLKSTYLDTLPVQADENGRVHTTYHQAKVVTGRLSSSKPNLQNIPVRTVEGRRIRSAFIAAPGYILLTADYSQIELRIIAHMADDPALLTVFAENGDVHRQTAAEIFNLPVADIVEDHRRIAKSINFGLIYGMSPFGLSRQLRIPLQEARHYVDRFFQKYPQVNAYMEDCRRLAKRNGYVETLYGRRIPTPEARRYADQQHAQRMAINAPMQGTAADIIKKAMISIDEWLAKRQYSTHMIMQVHDELVFEVPEGEKEETMENVKQLMEKADEGLLKSDLKVNISMGADWEEAH